MIIDILIAISIIIIIFIVIKLYTISRTKDANNRTIYNTCRVSKNGLILKISKYDAEDPTWSYDKKLMKRLSHVNTVKCLFTTTSYNNKPVIMVRIEIPGVYHIPYYGIIIVEEVKSKFILRLYENKGIMSDIGMDYITILKSVKSVKDLYDIEESGNFYVEDLNEIYISTPAPAERTLGIRSIKLSESVKLIQEDIPVFNWILKGDFDPSTVDLKRINLNREYSQYDESPCIIVTTINRESLFETTMYYYIYKI